MPTGDFRLLEQMNKLDKGAQYSITPVCHKWVLLDSNFRRESANRYDYEYTRVDTFFCEICLEYQEKKRQEKASGPPIWFSK